ncbi:MAG: MFS transporter, partial [Candidatus Thorarchaeota archaeon]
DNGLGFSSGSIFIIAALVMIISSFIVYFSIRLKDSIQFEEENIDVPMPSLSDLPQLLRRSYLIFLIALIFINFGRNSIAVITGLFLSEPTAFGATGEEIALYSNVGSIASMIMGVLIGSLIAKTDDNKVLFVGVLLPITGISWLILTPTFALSLIASFLIGASQVVIQSSSYSIVAEMAPEKYRGRLFAYYNTTFFLSWGIAATLVTGPVADILIANGVIVADAYRGSFIAAIALLIIGIIILIGYIRYTRSIGLFAKQVEIEKEFGDE